MLEPRHLDLVARVAEIPGRWPAAGLAVGVAREGSPPAQCPVGLGDVFAPLGMTSSDLLRSDRVTARLATGYTLGSRGPKALTERQWVTAAASSIDSTLRDMARYAAARLGGGSGEQGAAILQRGTLAMMYGPYGQPDARVPGTGLAFWRGTLGGHLLVERQGVLPGSNTRLDPEVHRVDLSRYVLGTLRVLFSRNAAGETSGLRLDRILLSVYQRRARRGGGRT